MSINYQSKSNRVPKDDNPNFRINLVVLLFFIAFLLVVFRLFLLMIVQHSFYTALASGSHDMYSNLVPERGEIYLQSENSGELFPVAINRDMYTMYSDNRKIEDGTNLSEVVEKLSEIFHYDDEKKEKVLAQLNKKNDPYEPLENKLEEEQVEEIKKLNLPNIAFSSFPQRYYPEGNLASQVIGFVGKNDDGTETGRYGLEGYWQKELAGSGGFLEGVRTAKGSWIPLAGRSLKLAEDGVDLVLTLDRTLQFEACKILEEFRKSYEAETATLVIMDPQTGAIKTMCSSPNFDLNKYNEVESIEAYNNHAIFTAYEPGSVFKPLIMGAALNEGIVTPDTHFFDSGSVEVGCIKPIQNAELKSYGDQTMTGVLKNSINTGMIFVSQKMGKDNFRKYVNFFGFGLKTGIELNTESSGTIDSLYISKKDEIDCYTANASFGQGIMATPLQLASAFSAIANGGKLMRPYIIDKMIYPNGKEEYTKSREIRTVFDKRTANLLSGMLVKVIDEGQGKLAKVPGYYIAGKTGTAQIAEKGIYTDDTNHTFIGFGPVDNPKFVLLVKFSKSRVSYASLTAANVFSKVAHFILQYYHIPPSR